MEIHGLRFRDGVWMGVIAYDVERIGPWVTERTGGVYYPGSGQAIGLEKDGVLVAGVLYDNFNGRSVQMHVASDGTRRWMTKQYLLRCFDYPFHQLKVRKIIGQVDSENSDALKFDLALGFVVEAVIKDASRKGDLMILTMTPEQCRWIDRAKE